MEFSSADIFYYLPAFIILLTALLLLGVELLNSETRDRSGPLIRIVLAGAGSAASILSLSWFISGNYPAVNLFNEMVSMDSLSVVAILVLGVVGVLSSLLASAFFTRHALLGREYHCLLFFSIFGMIILSTSVNLLSMLVGLEIMSVALYVLSGFFSANSRSLEAGLKYLVLGILSSGIVVYGIALIWGSTGTVTLSGIQGVIAAGGFSEMPFRLGIGLVLVGMGFKLAAVPFHMWAPDVYQGAPTPSTAFMSVGVKIAVVFFLIRFLNGALVDYVSTWFGLIWILSFLSIFAGNILAIQQQSLKRLLAYSSISHAGYILVGFLAARSDAEASATSIVTYMIIYSLMNLAAFGVLIELTNEGEDDPTLDSIRGLGRKHPLIGAAMLVSFVSLAGLPPTAGFMAKYSVFMAAIKSGLVTTVVLALIGAMIGVYYYLKVLVYLFMVEPESALSTDRIHSTNLSRLHWATIVLACSLILLGGVYPEPFILLARYSFSSFLSF